MWLGSLAVHDLREEALCKAYLGPVALSKVLILIKNNSRLFLIDFDSS